MAAQSDIGEIGMAEKGRRSQPYIGQAEDIESRRNRRKCGTVRRAGVLEIPCIAIVVSDKCVENPVAVQIGETG